MLSLLLLCYFIHQFIVTPCSKEFSCGSLIFLSGFRDESSENKNLTHDCEISGSCLRLNWLRTSGFGVSSTTVAYHWVTVIPMDFYTWIGSAEHLIQYLWV